MKKSKTTQPPQQFSNLRRRRLGSSERGIWVFLPEKWYLRKGPDQLVEGDMAFFQDAHACAAMLLDLTKKLGDVVEQMRTAVKKNKQGRTRRKRGS